MRRCFEAVAACVCGPALSLSAVGRRFAGPTALRHIFHGQQEVSKGTSLHLAQADAAVAAAEAHLETQQQAERAFAAQSAPGPRPSQPGSTRP